MNDWQVHIERDWTRSDGAKVTVYRRNPFQGNFTRGTIDVLTGWSDINPNEPVFTTIGAEDTHAADHALRLPWSVLEAIAETIKPGADQGEMKAVADALTVERGRVDAILARAIISR